MLYFFCSWEYYIYKKVQVIYRKGGQQNKNTCVTAKKRVQDI